MKTSVKWAAVASGLSLVLGISWVCLGTSQPGATLVAKPSTISPSPTREWALIWPADKAFHYSLEWKASAAVDVDASGKNKPQLLSASMDLTADWVLHSYGMVNNRFVVGVSLENIRHQSLYALGAPVFPNDEAAIQALSTKEVLVEMDVRGEWQALHFEPSQPTVYKEIIRSLLSEIQVIVPPDGSMSWNVLEKTPQGIAETQYRIDEHAPMHIRRTRVRYQQIPALGTVPVSAVIQEIDSRADVSFDPRGYIIALEHRERLAARQGKENMPFASQSFVRLELRKVEPWSHAQLPELARLQTIRPGDVIPSPESERAILEQHAAKFTFEELEQGLRTFSLVGTLPDERKWFIRATSYFRLHPELCARISDLFQSKEMNAASRQLVVELLASVGHSQAQRALREALSTREAAAEHNSYVRMVQGVGMVQKPEAESLAFLDRLMERAKKTGEEPTLRASEYALGAAIGAMSQQGEEGSQLATHYNQKLRAALDAAKTPEDCVGALAGLGNAGLEENASVIQRYAKDASASVREQVAISLRKIQSEDARATLLQLAEDEKTSVSAVALHVLRDQKLTPPELARLAESVTSGRTDPTLDSLLVTLLASQARVGDAPTKLLAFLLDRNSGNGALQARIRMLLDSRSG